MQARIFCPTHGRLDLSEVVIKDGQPLCGKCSTVLVYGKVQPRVVEQKGKKVKKKSKRR